MKKKQIQPFWLALSILLSALLLFLCLFAGRGRTLRLEADGDPQAVVTQFFDAVQAGNYAEAYACLSDYSSLGLEHEPTGADGRMLSRALHESYRYTLLGECAVTNLSATQSVQLQYLDLKAVEAAAAGQVDAVAQELVASHSSEEIYDENMQYLPAFTDEIYTASLERVLQNAESYYASSQLDLSLTYDRGGWKLLTSPTLFNALLGNA